MTDDEKQKMLEAQARGFREISILVLKGVADKEPPRFIREVKAILHKAAQNGA